MVTWIAGGLLLAILVATILGVAYGIRWVCREPTPEDLLEEAERSLRDATATSDTYPIDEGEITRAGRLVSRAFGFDSKGPFLQMPIPPRPWER
jgi:hypothetical protein